MYTKAHNGQTTAKLLRQLPADVTWQRVGRDAEQGLFAHRLEALSRALARQAQRDQCRAIRAHQLRVARHNDLRARFFSQHPAHGRILYHADREHERRREANGADGAHHCLCCLVLEHIARHAGRYQPARIGAIETISSMVALAAPRD